MPIIDAHNEFKTGVVTIGVTAAKLLNSGHRAYSYVLLEADAANGNDVYVGHDGSVSASNGWRLDAGQNVMIPINDPSKIWIIGGAADQKVKWLLV